MHKLVNGIRVELTEAEIAILEAEWAANAITTQASALADEALIYLTHTDYIILRMAEGYSVDEEVILKREQARENIRAYRTLIGTD